MTGPSKPRFQQLADLFEQALEIPEGPQRDAWVTRACKGDAELESELRRLLESDARLRSHTRSLPRFGVYQARELVGTGGMGAVYRATREDGDVRQQVAIKVVGAALWSGAMEERFRRERQILAELDHPNIARFLDAGVSAEGLPYLVLEFVDGQPLDRWCDGAGLSLDERLWLFLKVCAAVSFAHQKLVLHRDLKPANILVTAGGEPKLLDFGVARTLDPASANPAAQATSMFVTPHYASPESLRGEAVGVGCDVYSLGVLLFELLTGARPFGGRSSTPAQVVEKVLTGEAPLASSAAAASRRKELRGDLDAIVAKAVAQSPRERYGSVDRLAEDVKRYLDGFPVQAAPAGRLYRARKFTRRHRTAVAAAALVLFSILGGLSASLWQYRTAERRFRQTRALARYLMFDLAQSVSALPGSTPIRADMVQHSLEYLDALAAERTGDSALRAELGEGYARLGALLGHPSQPNLGDLTKAMETYRKAIGILTPAAGDPADRRAQLALAKARIELGQILGFQSESGEGVRLIEAATGDFARMAERWPSDFDVQIQASVAFEVLALALSRPQDYIVNRALDRSLPALRTAREHAEAAARLRPGDVHAVRQLAMTLKVMADFTELVDHDAATPLCRQALAALDGLGQQASPDLRSARSSVLLNCGDNLRRSGDREGARAALEEARILRDSLFAADPKNTLLLRMRVDPYTYLLRVGDPREQLRYHGILDGIYRQLLERYPSNQGLRFDYAIDQAAASNLYFDLGQKDEAARLARLSFPVIRQIAGDPQALGITQTSAATALLDAKTPGFGDPKLALELARRAASNDPETLIVLARACWANGDREGAMQAQEKAKEEAEKALAKYRAGR